MIKKIEKYIAFKKHTTSKNKSSKKDFKIFDEKKNNNYKIFFKFSLASIFLIFSFFSLPNITKYLEDNFIKNKTTINISKKNFELTLNSKKDKNSKIIESSQNDSNVDVLSEIKNSNKKLMINKSS